MLHYLDRRLLGIPVFSLKAAGPIHLDNGRVQEADKHEEKYKLIAYADDVKSSISTMQEFHTVIDACSLLERAAGVRLHRSVGSDKVKFLPLSSWKGMKQEDIPYDFIKLSEELDFIGVTLKSSFCQTRKINCDIIEEKVQKTVSPWKGGKFQYIVEWGHSANQYALSKVFFRCSSNPLRAATCKKVHSLVRGWILKTALLSHQQLFFTVHLKMEVLVCTMFSVGLWPLYFVLSVSSPAIPSSTTVFTSTHSTGRRYWESGAG